VLLPKAPTILIDPAWLAFWCRERHCKSLEPFPINTFIIFEVNIWLLCVLH
jgi:hypothetical protein